ncbi:MAG: DUF4870 domain-containing protein [Cyanobacteria bacterium P01_D01_bin.128]
MALEQNQEARNWSMAAHLSTLTGYVIPLGNIIGPLVIWLVKKDEMPFVGDQAKEALNFQISMLIYIIISAILVFVVIGIVLLFLIIIADLIFTIIAAVKAGQGVAYRYPMTMRLIS